MNYDLIYCDPPWEYGNRISNGAACNHYSTMSIEDLKRLLSGLWLLITPYWRCGIRGPITARL